MSECAVSGGFFVYSVDLGLLTTSNRVGSKAGCHYKVIYFYKQFICIYGIKLNLYLKNNKHVCSH